MRDKESVDPIHLLIDTNPVFERAPQALIDIYHMLLVMINKNWVPEEELKKKHSHQRRELLSMI